jgi:sigma-B regulation protein RsbU (phosphoserine phosphatase)
MKRLFFWRSWLAGGADVTKERAAETPAGGILTGDARLDEHSLQILLDSIADVTSTMDLGQVLEDIVDKSLQVSQAERGVLLLGASADDLQIRVARDRDGVDLGTDLQYSRSVVRRSLGEGRAMRSVVQSDQEALELGQSVFDLKLRAVMCAPLVAKDRIVGAIYVDSRAARREFSMRDLTLFGALSAQLAIAIVNAQLHADSLQKVRLEKDVEIARSIQQHLLADVPDRFPGLELAMHFLPADRASGDTYDFVPLPGGRLAILIGDVTGHGIGAALLSHAAQAATRSYLELIDDLGEVARRLNNRLVHGVETGNFMSMLLVLIDPAERRLHYVNAGHPPMLLARADRVECLEKTGMVLGVVEDAPYPVRGPIRLDPGDVLLLRTDGIDEAMDPQRRMYGDDRLTAELLAARKGTVDGVVERIETSLRQHVQGRPLEDDVTMIAIKVK